MKRQLLSAVALAALSMSCRGQTSKESPVFGIPNMFTQPRYDMQEESTFFEDHRTMRPTVAGTIHADEITDFPLSQGRLEDQSGFVLQIPDAVKAHFGGGEAMLARGKERYGIYCAPCHDGAGSGNGLVKQHAVASGAAAFVPPTFHQDRIRHMPDGQLYATIANGKGNMPPYTQVSVHDRWAIVSYVRALQVSQPKNAAE